MSIDRIHGPKGVSGVRHTDATDSVEATSQASATAPSSAASSIKQLAVEIQQGLPLETAMLRFAEQATRKRFGHLPEPMLSKACAEAGRTLAQDPSFQERFARLVASANK